MPVTTRGRAEQQRHFQRLPGEIAKVLGGAGRAGGNVIAEEAKLRSRSRDVSENVVVVVKATETRIHVRITVKPGFARSIGIWLEYGTDPHYISVDDSQRGGRTAARINDLARQGTLVINGKPVGATVFHPGAQPHPFLRPALDTKWRAAVAEAQAFINARLRRGRVIIDAGDEAGGA